MELARRLPRLLDEVKPELVLFDAGVDVHQDDVLGKLELTDQGMFDRDYYVMRVCASLAIPVATVVGGIGSNACPSPLVKSCQARISLPSNSSRECRRLLFIVCLHRPR